MVLLYQISTTNVRATFKKMPRRNNTPKHIPYEPESAAAPLKKRFSSKQAALQAIKELQKYHLDLELSTYQSPIDGGWYLTSMSQG
jgi:hypothetical protein